MLAKSATQEYYISMLIEITDKSNNCIVYQSFCQDLEDGEKRALSAGFNSKNTGYSVVLKQSGKELENKGAIRYDQDKPRMDLLSPIAMFATAQVMTKGLVKYPGSQWKKGMAWSKVSASLLRHMFKFMAGEDLDPESGLPHIDHVASNCMFLQEYFRKHKDLDDRIKTGLE